MFLAPFPNHGFGIFLVGDLDMNFELFLFFEIGSHCVVLVSLELAYVNLADLELIRDPFSLPPKCWD